MIGYKLMESDMTCCRGFQYEVGKKYSLDGKLRICENGFHFCENPFDCLDYYNNIKSDKRLFLIETLGIVVNGNNKSVTNKIKIVEEIIDIEKFFDKNIDNFVVDWCSISQYQKLSEKFIDKYSNKVCWFYISRYQTLSKEFIEKYIDKVCWHGISISQKLSEKFIDKYSNNVCWRYVSIYQKLSEKFIEKHTDKVDWYYILLYQKLSEEFIEKHKNKIIW